MAEGPLALGCFGKLPFWPEYIERSAGLPTARALRSWLHEGKETSATLADEEIACVDVPIRSRLRLLLGLPGSTELLIGVLRGSKDHGGRNFPFSVFAHVPRRLYGKHYALLPLAFAPVWDALDEAWDVLASVASKAAFDEVLVGLQAPQPEPAKQVVEAYKSGQERSIAALNGRADGACREALQEKLPEVLARLKQGNGEMGLELPVSSDPEEACFDATFWIDLLNRQFFMKRFEPSVLLDETRSREDRTVYLRFGKLDAADYPTVMGFGDPDTPFLRPAHPDEQRGAEAADDGPTYAEILASRFS